MKHCRQDGGSIERKAQMALTPQKVVEAIASMLSDDTELKNAIADMSSDAPQTQLGKSLRDLATIDFSALGDATKKQWDQAVSNAIAELATFAQIAPRPNSNVGFAASGLDPKQLA